MTKLRSISAFPLLLAGLITAAVSQAPAPSRLGDLVERFIAIVERSAPSEPELPFFPELRDEILRLNPGREQQVDEFVSNVLTCQSRLMAEAMPRAARASARALGEERLARLVAFLEGPDGQALERSRNGNRSALSEAQEEEWEQLRPDHGTFMYSIPNHVDPDSFRRMIRCYEDEGDRLRLRTQSASAQ